MYVSYVPKSLKSQSEHLLSLILEHFFISFRVGLDICEVLLDGFVINDWVHILCFGIGVQFQVFAPFN